MRTRNRVLVGWVVVDAVGRPLPTRRDHRGVGRVKLYVNLAGAMRMASWKGGRAVPCWAMPQEIRR